jgi:hypothetical protein
MPPSLGQLRRAKSDIEPGAARGAGLDHRPEHYVLKDLAARDGKSAELGG